MLPGPDHVVACPACQGLASHPTQLSGNTFGARYWSDGRVDAPMLTRLSPVAACTHCGRCFWLSEAEVVGSWNRWGGEEGPPDPAWADLPRLSEPAEEEYYRALEEELAPGRRRGWERAIRVLAWRRANDPFREGAAAAGPPAPDGILLARRRNLLSLLDLLRERLPDERLLKAEVLRELGERDLARALLARGFSRGPRRGFAAALRALCEQDDPTVRELHFGRRGDRPAAQILIGSD